MVELSIVMPCLNEAETLESCIVIARQSLERLQISAEIVVADNGSTDDSLRPAGLYQAAYGQLGLGTTGMEFASEMVVKASLNSMRVREVPVLSLC
jgi:glycosyltransferase involved in cell wall biosynthesis